MDTDTWDHDEDVMITEYRSWSQDFSHSQQLITLDKFETDDDGSKSLHFIIDTNQTFVLRCPQNYPHYEEDNFFVEAPSSLQLWCNALNEFLLDSADNLKLGAILSKGCSLYSSKDKSVEIMDCDENSDDEDLDHDEDDDDDELDDNAPEDYHLDDLLDQDLNWELEIARRKKRWKLKEDELRDESGKKKIRTLDSTLHPDSNLKTSSRQPKQIFTSAGASGILINDLVNIMETVKETHIVADSVDDNIFLWNVKMSNFEIEPLSGECQRLESDYGYDYIELQMEFSMDLYPFFPPLVKVIRPRLQGSMMLRVTTMEILKLTYWDPARDMKSVLMDIKQFLAQRARLDLNSERNDRERYPDGAYIDIEHHLLRLALVSEVTPRVNKKYTPLEPLQPIRMTAAAFANHDDDKPGPSKINIESSDDSDEGDDDDDDDIGEMMLNKVQSQLTAQNLETNVDLTIDADVGINDILLAANVINPEPNAGAEASDQEEAEEPPPLPLAVQIQEPKSTVGFSMMSKFLKMKSKKKERNKEDPTRKTIAKGTGYSSYNHKGWDVKAYMAAQKEKDRQIEIVLEKILEELKKFRRMTTVKTRNLPDLLFEAAASSSSASLTPVETLEDADLPTQDGRVGNRKRKHSPEAIPVDPISDLYAVLEGSALVPFLESRLQSSSFLEICRHATVFKLIIGILREMSEQSCLVSLLGPLPDQQTSLHSLLQNLESQARIVNDKIGKASANGSVPCKDKSEVNVEPEPNKKSGSKVKSGQCDDGQGLIIARDFLSLSMQVTEALKSTGYLPDINGITGAGHRTDTPSPVAESPVPGPSGTGGGEENLMEDGVKYVSVMAPLQYDSMEFASAGHAFMSEFNGAAKPSSQTIFRIAQEVSSVAASSSLPCSLSSSVFVRSDDGKMTLLKAIITGPTETPYTGGVYEFDIYFPNGYPRCPPKVKFRTTGAGSVRFNPNLYNEGKVCLSLLGTWGGAKGEEWNGDTSTIIQVLVSIQSLILVPEPYYNEPGYERNYGTTTGNRESHTYNENVFRNNLRHAILGQLRAPPEGFDYVTKCHFYFKRDTLIKELESQGATYKSKEIQKLLTEVKAELLKLEKPMTM